MRNVSFDLHTELLTNNGFKNITNITVDDKIFTRAANDNILQFENVISTDSIKSSDYIYTYEGKNVSIGVDGDSDILVNKRETKDKIRKNNFTLVKKIKNQDIQFVSSGGFWYGNQDENYTMLDKQYNAIDFAYLMGIFCTDGSVNNQGNITVNQSKKDIILKIRNILQKLNLKFTESISRGNVVNFYLSRQYLPYFEQFYLKENRKIPLDLKNYNVIVLKSLLEGLIDGDGSEGRRICVGSKTLTDDIQELCYKLGKSSCFMLKGKGKLSWYEKDQRWIKTNKNYHIIGLNNREYLCQMKNNIEINKGETYKITILNHNAILSRRNGKCIWV